MDVVSDLAGLPYADALEPHAGPITGEGDYDTVHFADQEFDDAQGAHARFVECAFTSVTFTGGRYRRARFINVWMKGPRLVGTDLAETEWRDGTVISGALAGVAAFDATLRQVTFSGCKLDGVNFRGARLTDVSFVDCVLKDVDFGGARLTGVRFPGSALRALRLDNATLKKVDLRGATELDLASGYQGLGGAIIDEIQLISIAPALARELGITVKER